MLSTPQRQEIDHRTIKLLVGIIAVSLAPVTSLLTGRTITSISAAYHAGGLAETVFVGFLFAISALILAYNGYSVREMVVSKIAGVAGLGVAIFPCQCDTHTEIIPHAHGIFAGTMFIILAYLCHAFRQRAKAKGYPEARIRARIYAVCGLTIVAVILVLGFNNLRDGELQRLVPRLVFYGEAAGLTAFGISWMTASRRLPGIGGA